MVASFPPRSTPGMMTGCAHDVREGDPVQPALVRPGRLPGRHAAGQKAEPDRQGRLRDRPDQRPRSWRSSTSASGASRRRWTVSGSTHSCCSDALTPGGFELPGESPDCASNWFQFPLRFADYGAARPHGRSPARATASTRPSTSTTSPMWPARSTAIGGDCPNAERLSRTTLLVPIHYTLDRRDIEHIAASINEGSRIVQRPAREYDRGASGNEEQTNVHQAQEEAPEAHRQAASRRGDARRSAAQVRLCHRRAGLRR